MKLFRTLRLPRDLFSWENRAGHSSTRFTEHRDFANLNSTLDN